MRILVTDPRVLSSASIARIAFIICNSTVRLVSRIIVAVSCPSGASFWIIASMLMTWHNLHYFQELMQGLRDAIATGGLKAFVADFHAQRAQGDIAPL